MYWYDGRLYNSTTLQLDVTEPGLLYGATVFTTLRVYQQSLQHPRTYWEGHLRRLRESIELCEWNSPDWNCIDEGAKRLCSDFPVLRIALFPDGRELITGRSLPGDLLQRQQQGVVAWVAEKPQFRRAIPEAKTGNYLPAWLALQQAKQQGAVEAILTDSYSRWCETSTGNLWGWCEGKWWTPPLEVGILPGLAREQICDRASWHNISIGQQPWSESLVVKFEAMAYTNSVVEVVPIWKVVTGDAEASLTFDPNHPSLRELRSLLVGDLY
ncbi:aminotransferase class IV [Baaleninema simplex]|uniref:aminotransferase class IV n=1 Tax=Baaleninema simplex TaxID=2862350 RepID=UPI000346A6C6|nr:aminotransferase class IV [Baaleninema simplex]